ncbi:MULTISPECIES: MlaD family protein [Tsukamurella]|uniref:MlaD family protein n=1 Tax=Tsukamurella TaxID=2060 RepID=UPI002DD44335|nr:MlaD family protein [Tsukamurella tyrosinosolvens]MEC4616362.1 MlaD family protein [Tsukamurella tyrosinosolvens]
MALLSGGYVLTSVLHLDLSRDTYTVELEMNKSAGLMDTSVVTLYGLQIGKVRSITAHTDRLSVEVELDSAQRVPLSTGVSVRNLSAAGEQYVDFRPETSAGPYLSAGSRIPASQVTDIATAGDVTAKIDRLGEMIDPAAVRRLADLMVQIAQDRTTLDNTKVIAGLMADTVRDKSKNISGVYRQGQLLDERLTAAGAAEKIRTTAPIVDRLAPALGGLIEQLGRLAGLAVEIDPFTVVTPLLNTLYAELDRMLPGIGALSATLTPATAQLRGIRVNVGAFTDMWARAFPVGGPARVELSVK